jgi:hypothetical protein
MQTMGKIFAFIFLGLGCLSCSKKDTASPSAIDYNQYKIKTATHSVRNYSGTTSSISFDTTLYIYDGTTCKYTRRQNNSTQEYIATLSNGLYTQVLYVNGILSSQKIYYQLNAAGYIDSNWITNNTIVAQSSKNQYNTDGTLAAAISYFQGYTNRIQYNYKNGIADYAYGERIASIPSITNARDSLVYEYAGNLPYRAGFYSTGLPASFAGKPAKNLLQKTTYYNKLNSNAIRQTIEYQYQTNDIGLVTRRVLNIHTQPGNTLIQTDTTAYSYYGK